MTFFWRRDRKRDRRPDDPARIFMRRFHKLPKPLFKMGRDGKDLAVWRRAGIEVLISARAVEDADYPAAGDADVTGRIALPKGRGMERTFASSLAGEAPMSSGRLEEDGNTIVLRARIPFRSDVEAGIVFPILLASRVAMAQATWAYILKRHLRGRATQRGRGGCALPPRAPLDSNNLMMRQSLTLHGEVPSGGDLAALSGIGSSGSCGGATTDVPWGPGGWASGGRARTARINLRNGYPHPLLGPGLLATIQPPLDLPPEGIAALSQRLERAEDTRSGGPPRLGTWLICPPPRPRPRSVEEERRPA